MDKFLLTWMRIGVSLSRITMIVEYTSKRVNRIFGGHARIPTNQSGIGNRLLAMHLV
jgi:hypothetical protein